MLFGAVNLIQAYFTPIAGDEAYYWMYGQNLDWGFFDHPPMVAAMIWLGSHLFGGALGVRLITVLLLSGALPVIWMTLDEEVRKQPGIFELFLLLVAVSPILNIYGFITTPDAPLLFFAARYLWAFKKLIKNPSLSNGFLVGVFMAGMAWSKYHGVLVVIFTVAGHWRILKEKYFYLATVVAALLFAPHLIWQYQHDFLTFRFHLGSRAKDPMELHNVTEYFLNSLLILNPLLVPVFIYQFFKNRKTLKVTSRPEIFLFWGFLGFFAVSTLKGHVEPHWIAVSGIALVLLLLPLASDNLRLLRLLRTLAWITLPLVWVLRILLMLPLDLPTEFHRKGRPHYETIQATAGKAEVVFANSYTDAAKHTFYTGKPAWSYNNIFYRPNQYDLWPYADNSHGKAVFFINGWTDGYFDTLQVGGENVFYKRITEFQTARHLKVEILEIDQPLNSQASVTLKIALRNTGSFPVKMDAPVAPLSFSAVLTEGRRSFHTAALITEYPMLIPPGDQPLVLQAKFKNQAPPGEYQLGIGVKPGKIPEILISEYMPVVVK